MKPGTEGRISKKTAATIIRSLVANVGAYPGTRIATSDCVAIVTNALGEELHVCLTGFTVHVIRNPGKPLETHIGHLNNRQIRARFVAWDCWARFLLAGHCAGIPKQKVIEALTRLKIEAAEADRFEDALHYFRQIRQVQGKA